MEIQLKYGEGHKTITIPASAHVEILAPATMPSIPAVEDALAASLTLPIGTRPLREVLLASKPKRIAIAVPDETRPAPLGAILPHLLTTIHKALPDLPPSDTTIVIGGGLHPPMDEAGIRRIIPAEVQPLCRIVAHDPQHSAMLDFGITSRGTPVSVNAEIGRADFKIVVGQIDPHQFVGFTGGSKGITIGCAAPASIEHNHSLMFDPKAQVGILAGNPVREDLNEAGQMVAIDFAINVVLGADKKAVRVLAGDPVEVLKAGAQTCAKVYGVGIVEKFDIVVASCGGHPKDICLYQAQKGLNLASQAVKKGGHILLLAASPQGVGDDIYFDYVSQFTTPDEVLTDFQKLGFKMGAHKAYLFGRTLTDFNVAVLSEIEPGILRKCHLRAAEPANVIKEWVEGFGARCRVAVIPNANTTYFYQRQD